jgi:hypothetical protein
MSLIATRIQNWRVDTPEFDKNMTRPSEYGALDFFVNQTDSGKSFVTPDLKAKAMASIGTTLQMPAIDFDAGVTVANTRTCAIADSENTSTLHTVTFATFAIGFTMVPALYMNNDVSYSHDFRRKMEKITRAMADALDQGAVAALEANKTQVMKELLIYESSANKLDIPWDMRQEILGDLNPMMRANDYRGEIHLIGNAGIDSMIRKMTQHGMYNDVNKQLEYAGKVFHFTNNVANAADQYATAFAVESGQVGILTRAGRENILGTKSNDHEWDIVRIPILDLPIDTHYYTAVGDQSGIAGESSADMTCNVKEHFGFAVDVAFLTSYNSDPATIAEPIVKLQIGKSDAVNPVAIPVHIVEGVI